MRRAQPAGPRQPGVAQRSQSRLSSRHHTNGRSGRRGRSAPASAVGGAAPSAASEMAGNSVSCGKWARLMPMPMASQRLSPAAFQQDAGELFALGQHVIGPFDRDGGVGREMRRHVGRRQRGGKRQLRPFGLRRSGVSSKRGGKIAVSRCPRRGPGGRGPRVWRAALIQSGPALAGFGQAARFLVGGIQFGILRQAIALRPESREQRFRGGVGGGDHRRGGEDEQQRHSAGQDHDGARAQARCRRRSASAGSSKYIIFTRRR